jgi:hypothetical protein
VSDAQSKVADAERDVDRYIFEHQIRPTITPDTIAEHRSNPFGAGHSPELEILLRYLRRNPVRSRPRYMLVETEPYQEWSIALHARQRGEPLVLTGETFTSQADAQHEIFLKRLLDLDDPEVTRIVETTRP